MTLPEKPSTSTASSAYTPDVASGSPASFDSRIADGPFVFEPIGAWARTAPDRPALVGGGARLTYAELESETNRRARFLRARGVCVGDRVAIVLPRGPEAILTLIAALKAGASYVPLDPETPAERIRLCLEDAAPRLIICERPDDGPAIPLEELRQAAAAQPAEPLDPSDLGLTPDHIAYIIFTSGTTGRPKGVPITHAGLTNFVRGDQAVCMLVEGTDRVFQGFSPASDGHHEEVWPTFQAGALLVVATPDDIHAGPELAGLLNRHGVTIISCAPTLLSMLDDDVPTLRRVLFGAERCPEEMVRRWWRPDREIVNTYGPTEATVGATFARCVPGRPITIGRALPNYYCTVLDDDLRPVPEGAEGELCISGVGVSPGYIGSAAGAQRFVPNPQFDPALRNPILYRTGDRVRMSTDGEIEWLGRIDSQVKIRGYRIEVSDIESHLVCEESVRAAAVITRDDETGTPHLVALMAARSGMVIDPRACRERLRAALPSYMTPEAYEIVDQLPVLPSGKIDRRTVQRMRGEPLVVERTIEAPATATEKRIAHVWAELFPGRQISADDDFFADLGGYSLLAARCVSLLRAEAGFAEVSVLDLYEAPALRALAARMEARAGSGATRPAATPVFAPVPQGRYYLAAMAQAVGIITLFGIRTIFWLAPLVAAGWFSYDTGKVKAVVAGLVVHAISVPVSLGLAVALKWLVIGRTRPGDYPVWGGYFLRWWFVQRLQEVVPRDYITGTPLAPLFLRLLGGRVGSNANLESLEIDCPDLVEIGDDCSLETLGWIRCATVAHGMLTIRPIRIGNGCSIGVRSGVAGGAVLNEGVWLADLSCVSENTEAPAGEEWVGSPARRREEPTVPAYDRSRQPCKRDRFLYGAAQFLAVVIFPLIDVMPFIFITLAFWDQADGLMDYLMAPAFSLGLLVLVCTQVCLLKWVVLGRLRPGTYYPLGLTAFRKWFVDKVMELHKDNVMPVYDTLFARPWCSSLGMKMGARVEIALPAKLPYDLVEMGDESFLASDSSVGMPMRRNDQLILERTVVKPRTFLGNNSVIPQGVTMPEDCLLGALSLGPSADEVGTEPDRAWLGSPAFIMPGRERFEQFDAESTYRPTARLYIERLIRETVRIVLPGILLLIVISVVADGFFTIENRWSLADAIIASPLLYAVGALVGALCVMISKKVLIGRYAPRTEPLWSRYVWNSETFSAVFHDFGAPLFLMPLLGTPYLNMILRWYGAKIGRRVFLDTSDLTEFDLLEIGDDAAVNHNAALQAHLFEDRVMKVGALSIGARASVGTCSVILFESVMEPDSHVGPLSLVMKGETIPSNTRWVGSPAQVARASVSGRP